MINDALRADIEAIERDTALYVDLNFTDRLAAVDFLDFHVINRIDSLLQLEGLSAELLSVRAYAVRVINQLDAVDNTLFQRLKEGIRAGYYRGTSLLALIKAYVRLDQNKSNVPPAVGYDTLDMFTNSLFADYTLPMETKQRTAEMIYYQKTPARISFELANKIRLIDGTVFYDIGSGLGQVAIWVNLLTGAVAKGIELEPAYCIYARHCATDLNLSQVSFVEADARTADYSDGTVFFMYTPFEGSLLQASLDRLRETTQGKPITLFTYGPCTHHVALQTWLEPVGDEPHHTDKLGEFSSALR